VQDLFHYAHSFHKAAKTLAASFQPEANASGDFLPAVCPVIFMYRHAVELHLKGIVLADGGNFLKSKPDPISVCTSHSVSWLAQFVCRIVTVLHWEQEFRCEGIETLADFRAVVEELNSIDPGTYNFQCPVDPRSQSSVRDFVKKMDTLIDLLESTAKALAAQRDLRPQARRNDKDWNGGGFNPTIQ
jgi:hypothetical protein